MKKILVLAVLAFGLVGCAGMIMETGVKRENQVLNQFIVDSKKTSEYTDLTDKSEITISMKDLAFNPQKIIINGTLKRHFIR